MTDKKVLGVGVYQKGKYKAIGDTGATTKEYDAWRGMLRRCYSKKSLIKRPTYTDCTVCDEWLVFQNFAKWYEENYYQVAGERVALDKDTLIKGNDIYSPETCVFVPHSINSLLTKSNAIRGKLPIGVSFHKKTGKYRASCSNGEGKQEHLGLFNTSDEAFLTYKKYKEMLIKKIADKFKGNIPSNLYEALMLYEVNIDD